MKYRNNTPIETKDASRQTKETPSHWELSIAAIESSLRNKNYVTAYSQLLKLAPSTHPRKIQALSRLAFVARHLNKRSEALSYLKQAELADEIKPADLKFIAAEYVALENYHYAITTIKKIEPMDGQTFHFLGYSYFRQGDIGKALPIYKKLFFHIPENPSIARELSLVAAEFRDYKTAITAFSRYLQLIHPSASDHLKFADLLLMGKQVKESQKELRKAVEMGEKSPHADLINAKINRLSGNYNESIKNANQAILKEPKLASAWQIIAELISPSDINDELIARLQHTTESYTDNPIDSEIYHFSLSEIHIKQGNYLEAYKQIKLANRIKFETLKRANNTYNPKRIEENIKEIIKAFNSLSNKPTASSSQYRPIFIVGMPRSGTTLINKIIENSGNARSIGESEEFPRIISQLELEFEGQFLKHLHKVSGNKWKSLAESYIKANEANEKQVIDKMPSNLWNVGLIFSLFPRARIIQLSRNPFDVCMSILSKPFPEGHTYACREQDIAHYYYQSTRLIDYWSKVFPDKIFNINFDEFLSSPTKKSIDLFNFLGYEWNDSFLSLQKESNNFTFSELQVRKPISSNEAEKWRPFFKVATDLKKALKRESKNLTSLTTY
ncbi:tetratricopeptide repeat-containing sulfotransferase family protein [Microbulbifer variabilis]|uniref:tetratricopeptide repeat-containing sulfotransferase family protein n=1 Tax=Microbulbifer variabilis TaxID=266805 RepID=UPI001CFE4506|nr:tetratricopeptide repeat-containing sulfotransferase family protein [Microbulbifer variabilis]